MPTHPKALSIENLGGIFTLSKEDFIHINTRVNQCITSKNAVAVISRSLPPFKDAVTAAEQWRNTLYPELRSLANDMDSFSAVQIESFTSFNIKVETLGADVKKMPSEIKAALTRLISVLNEHTKPLYLRFEKVTSGLFSFIEANTALDIAISQKDLGFKMAVIRTNLNRLQTASSHVLGGWQGLHQELQNYSAMEPEMDIVFMAALELKAAISGWVRLREEARKFLNEN